MRRFALLSAQTFPSHRKRSGYTYDPKITVEDIKNFEDSYKGSEEERDAVKSIYLEKEGDMDALLENVCIGQ